MKTGGLSAEATFLANLLAQNIDRLSDVQCSELSEVLNNQLGTGKLSAYISPVNLQFNNKFNLLFNLKSKLK